MPSASTIQSGVEGEWHIFDVGQVLVIDVEEMRVRLADPVPQFLVVGTYVHGGIADEFRLETEIARFFWQTRSP